MFADQLAKTTTVLMLAGGRGTRIAALTPNTPKPMVLVANEPFIEWIVRRLVREHFTNILLSIGHMADVFTSWMRQREPRAGEKLRDHIERQPLGTGGAIADALSDVDTDYVLVLNGDTLLLCDFLPAIRRMAADNLDGIIIARSLPDTGRYGRLSVEGGLLKSFDEKKAGQGLINGGAYAFRTEWLRSHIGSGVSSMEVDVFPRLLSLGARIGVEITQAPFIDIGTPETLAETSDFLEKHRDCF